MIAVHVDRTALRGVSDEERSALESTVRTALVGCTEVADPGRADVVQAFRTSDAAQFVGRPFVLAVTGLEDVVYGAGGSPKDGELPRLAMAVAVPSGVARHDVVARQGVAGDRVRVIGAPLLLPRPAWRSRPAVVVPAAVRPHRNAEAVIAAYGRLPAETRRRHPLVIGTGRGELRAHLRSVAASAGVRVAWDRPVPRALPRAGVAVFPAFWDGYAPGAAEAATLGVTVVASTASAAAELAVDPELLFRPREPGGLQRALARALEAWPSRPPPRSLPDAGAALRELWRAAAAGEALEPLPNLLPSDRERPA